MKLINLTMSAVLSMLLICSIDASAQTRRESRPSRSQNTTRSEVKSNSNSSSSRRVSSSRVQSPSQDRRPAPQARPSSQGRKPSPQARPSSQDRRPSSQTRPSSSNRREPMFNGFSSAPKPPKQAGVSASDQRPSRRPSNNGSSNVGRRPSPIQQGDMRPNDRPGGAGFEHRPNPDQGHHGAVGRPPRPQPHPFERRPINHRHPSRFYDHGHHYYGYRINRLPHDHHIDIFWGRKYYICDGVYYRLYNGSYYVCRPPYGYYFSPSLYSYAPVICAFAFYNFWDRSYNIINENYRIIDQQNQQIARNNAVLASQNASLASYNNDGNTQRSAESYVLATRLGLVQSYAALGTNYYYDDGVFFILNSRGEYETIVPPAGAIVENLPEDYEEVRLNDGNLYYLVDDTVYRLTINEGKPVFEVLGQIQR